MYASTSFLPLPAHPLLQSKSTSIWMHHILRLSASAQKMLMLLKTSEPSGTSQSICTRTIRNWKTSPAICTGTLRNLTSYLHLNFLEPYRVPAPEPSATSPAICTYRNPPCTGRNLSKYLHLNPPEPHLVSTPEVPPELQQVSAPEPSRTLRNPPEPCPEPGVEAAPDRTRANLG